MIDGAVRDVYEIREFNCPVFAHAILPNADDTEGCREIGVEITCGG